MNTIQSASPLTVTGALTVTSVSAAVACLLALAMPPQAVAASQRRPVVAYPLGSEPEPTLAQERVLVLEVEVPRLTARPRRQAR